MTDAELRDLLQRTVSVLKDHQMHEPDCPVRRAQRHNHLGRTFMIPGECDCWLSENEDGDA